MRNGFVFILLLFNCLYQIVSAQNLDISRFEEIPLDVTARTSSVQDANGISCALLKIFCNDEIRGVDGSVVKSIDKDGEYWVYIPSGTKKIIVKTLHHSPIEVKFDKLQGHGLSSGVTYQLELKSDLPSEVLYGTFNPLMPVTMAKEGEPLLPKWWNTQEKGMYVGISLPTLDGETAKISAITNAVYSYVHSTGCDVEYAANIHMKNVPGSHKSYQGSDEHKAYYKGFEKGFSINVSQEYYNSKGEYFVLCAIKKEAKSSNLIIFDWNLKDLDVEDDLSLSVNIALKAMLNKFPIESALQYTVSHDYGCVRYCSLSCNGKDLLKDKYLDTEDDISNFILCGDLGLSQIRLLTTIPLLSDTISFSSYSTINDDSSSLKTMISSTGKSIVHDIQLLDYTSKGLSFGVSEQFPDVQCGEDFDAVAYSQITGLSNKYRGYLDSDVYAKALTSVGFCDNKLIEISKNISFLDAMSIGLSRLCTEVKSSKYVKNGCSESKILDSEDFSSFINNTIPIYPIYYLDPKVRVDYKEKKFRKERNEIRNQYPYITSVVIPTESFINMKKPK